MPLVLTREDEGHAFSAAVEMLEIGQFGLDIGHRGAEEEDVGLCKPAQKVAGLGSAEELGPGFDEIQAGLSVVHGLPAQGDVFAQGGKFGHGKIPDDFWPGRMFHAAFIQRIKSFHRAKAQFLGQMQAFHVFVIGAEFIAEAGVLPLQPSGKAEQMAVHHRGDALALIFLMHAQAFKPEHVVWKEAQFQAGDHFAFVFTDKEIGLIDPAVEELGQIVVPIPDTFGNLDQIFPVTFPGQADLAFIKLEHISWLPFKFLAKRIFEYCT